MKEKTLLNREYWIDAVRSFACLCVITTHAPIPGDYNYQGTIAFTNYFSVAGASILFFMISGALVLYKEKPVFPFLKKRISRIVLPMVIWTIISLLIEYFLGDLSGSELIDHIIKIPFAPQVGTYWFIYVIFGIYLVTPILASWLSRASKREVEFYLALWGITLFLPYINVFTDFFSKIISYSHGYLYLFYGYLGFAVLGYYLRKYINIKKLNIRHILYIIFVLSLPIILYNIKSIPHGIVQHRMTINIALLSICYFLIIKHIKFNAFWSNILYDFAQHSFGIYLVQIIVMRKILWPLIALLNLNYIIQIPLVVLLTALCSYIVVHIISKLPYSKYIVGLES